MSKPIPMGTRSKDKSSASSESEKEMSSRDFDAREIERQIEDKVARLKEQEMSIQTRAEVLDNERQKFEKERQIYAHNVEVREAELRVKERELSKKWSDNTNATILDPIHQTTPMYDPVYAGGCDDMPPVSAPKVSFRDATESVPAYDGYNISLNQFTQACRRALDIIPPSAERNLTKLLTNKLRGRAYRAVEGEPCDSIADLIDLLTGVFRSPKTIDQYRGELSDIYMKPREHVIDYISRVKELRATIVDADHRNKRSSDPRFLAEIDELTTRSFYAGLPLTYRMQIGPEMRQHYTDAFAAAKTIAKEQELDEQRLGPTGTRTYDRNYGNTNHIGRPLAHSTPQRQTYDQNQRVQEPRYRDAYTPRGQDRYRAAPPPRRENYQDTRDRRDDYGRQTTPRVTEYAPRDARQGPTNTRRSSNIYEEVICRYCKNPGHTLEECRKRQYNNSRKENTGNFRGPSGRQDVARSDENRGARPVNAIQAEIEENDEVESESQS